MSAAHTWLARSIFRSRSRSEWILCPGAGFEAFGFGPRAFRDRAASATSTNLPHSDVLRLGHAAKGHSVSNCAGDDAREMSISFHRGVHTIIISVHTGAPRLFSRYIHARQRK